MNAVRIFQIVGPPFIDCPLAPNQGLGDVIQALLNDGYLAWPGVCVMQNNVACMIQINMAVQPEPASAKPKQDATVIGFPWPLKPDTTVPKPDTTAPGTQPPPDQPA